MVKKEYINIINSYISKLRENQIPFTEIYLFGSRIKGTETKWSDLDACIVSDTFGTDRQQERIMLMNLREGITNMIEPHPISTLEFESNINPFVKEVKRTGVKVF